jgi:hypothetical protein
MSRLNLKFDYVWHMGRGDDLYRLATSETRYQAPFRAAARGF